MILRLSDLAKKYGVLPRSARRLAYYPGFPCKRVAGHAYCEERDFVRYLYNSWSTVHLVPHNPIGCKRKLMLRAYAEIERGDE